MILYYPRLRHTLLYRIEGLRAARCEHFNSDGPDSAYALCATGPEPSELGPTGTLLDDFVGLCMYMAKGI